MSPASPALEADSLPLSQKSKKNPKTLTPTENDGARIEDFDSVTPRVHIGVY